jgi:hypothetical protein
MNANPQREAPLGLHWKLTFSRRALDGKGALDGADHAGKLRQRAITCIADDPPAMLGHQGFEHFGPQGPDAPERARLINADEATVANDVGADDGSEPSLQDGLCYSRTIILRMVG